MADGIVMDRAKLEELRARPAYWDGIVEDAAMVDLTADERDALFAYIDELENWIQEGWDFIRYGRDAPYKPGPPPWERTGGN